MKEVANSMKDNNETCVPEKNPGCFTLINLQHSEIKNDSSGGSAFDYNADGRGFEPTLDAHS